MKTRILGMLLCLLGTASCTNHNVKNNTPVQMESDITKIEGPYSSITLSRKYYETFEDGTRSDEEPDYPDYLGGSYTDSVGNLVFLVKGDMVKAKKDILRRIGYVVPNLRFKPCKYSLRALHDLVDQLTEQFENDELREELGWTFISVAVMENKVYVSFEDCSDSIIAKFKANVSDSEMIAFEQMIIEPLSAPVDSVCADSRAASK